MTTKWGEFRVETELESAGFLAGLEGEAKAAQLKTLRALTSLDLVKEDGAFSIDRFGSLFGGMKPVPTAVTPVAEAVVAPAVVDLGGNGTPPAAQDASRFEALKTLRETAMNRGQRMEVIRIDRELNALQTKK